MRKYFYFRDVTDEDHDDDVSASITIPVNDITGVVPTAITTLDVYYNSGDKTVPTATGGTGAGTGKVTLTCTRGKLFEVMGEIAAHANSTKPANAGLIIMGDRATTGYGGEAQTDFFFSDEVTSTVIS
tara:strand:+ start:124 stop:507 length:384 start_codon:yes stop_codon:yes gene_type:complete